LFIETYWGYALWAAVQQFLLQCFFLSRLRRLLPSERMAAAAAAFIFALAHLPSPILASVTLLWGFAACLLFLRYRNLYTLAMAHAILGITIAITIPGPVIRNMRVGLGYLTYGHTHRPVQSPQP
jgi:membrane protease YdiL (CAAX protease family)